MAVQHHCHISDTIGSAPELAPDTRFKIAQNPGRERIPNYFMSIRRSTNGTLRPAVLLDNDGEPFSPKDLRYSLLIREWDGLTVQQQLDRLESWVGKPVYVVDIDHPNDGADHTASVRTMFLSQMSPQKTDHPTGLFYIIDVELLDLTENT